MSDDPSPPDLTETAEFPLDEFSPKPQDAVVDHPPVDHPSTLFRDAQPLGLSQSRTGSPAGSALSDTVIEGAEGPFADRLRPTRSIERLRAFLVTGRDHADPLYRRQGTLAVVGLCLLSVLVAVSFPRTRATLGSGLDVMTNDSGDDAGTPAVDPAAPAASLSGNHSDGIDPVGSEGLFTGASGDGSVDRSRQPRRTSGTALRAPTTDSTQTTAGPTEQLPTFAELTDTSAAEDPAPSTCLDPAATAPDCESPAITEPGIPPDSSTSSPTTAATDGTEPTIGEDATTSSTAGEGSGSTTSSTEPSTTTTGSTTTAKPTTTKKPTTTAKPTTTKKPTTTAESTTTEKPTTTAASTTTTKRPTTTKKSTTTTEPTTTTTEPTTTETTAGTTTTTSGPPDEGTSTPTFIQCAPDGGPPPCPQPGP